ncbi:MAG: glycosyltransferase [Clostridiales bacterium]|nr:glycosyltransferase [Clostridiales bacterium]
MIVPEHIKNQNKLVDVSVLNCSFEKNHRLEINDKKVFYFKDYTKLSLSKLLNEEINPKLAIFHGIYIYDYIKIYKILKKQNIPYIIVPHGSLTRFSQNKKRIKKVLGNFVFFNNFINGAIAIQYLTEAEKTSSLNYLPNSIVSGNGMYIKDNVYLSEKVNKEEFNITFIARLDPYHKGIDLLIEGCKSIQEDMKRNNIKVRIFGPDHEGGKQKVYNLIKNNKLQDIIYVGDALYGAAKEKELKRTDIFILTSRFEGQPLGVLEAISKGVPVIITPGTNISKEVEEYKCGFIANPLGKSIGEQILNAFYMREKLNLYSNNCIIYAKNYISWEVICEQTVKLYEKCIVESKRK